MAGFEFKKQSAECSIQINFIPTNNFQMDGVVLRSMLICPSKINFTKNGENFTQILRLPLNANPVRISKLFEDFLTGNNILFEKDECGTLKLEESVTEMEGYVLNAIRGNERVGSIVLHPLMWHDVGISVHSVINTKVDGIDGKTWKPVKLDSSSSGTFMLIYNPLQGTQTRIINSSFKLDYDTIKHRVSGEIFLNIELKFLGLPLEFENEPDTGSNCTINFSTYVTE